MSLTPVFHKHAKLQKCNSNNKKNPPNIKMLTFV